MMLGGLKPATRGVGIPQAQHTEPIPLPAPFKGINASDNLFSLDQDEAIYMYNLLPDERGSRIRQGYVQHSLDEVGYEDVRTLMPYTSPDGTTKLFAATIDGIYDVTASGTSTHTKVLSWTTATGNAGWCVFVQYTVTGGGHYLMIADEVNGLTRYDGTTWTKNSVTSDVTGPTNVIVFIMAWKDRLWFAEKDTANAWYLAPGAISGAAVSYSFGNRFTRGGDLVGLWSYTRDGGDGIDDFLIAISRGGDLLVYQGYDPGTSSAFSSVGAWYIGDMPTSRRIAAEFGADLLILSSYGVLSISKLLRGDSIADPDFYITYKIAPLVREVMAQGRSSFNWEIVVHPKESIFIIIMPITSNNARQIQYAMNLNTGAWGSFRDLPINCTAVYQDKLYFGNVADTTARLFDYSGLTGTFEVGETITGGTSLETAVIVVDTGTELVVRNVSGTFTLTETITGGTSGADATLDVDVATGDAAVWYMDGAVDKAVIAGTNLGGVAFSMLQSFTNFGLPGRWKRVHFVRPVFRSAASPSYSVCPRFDFDYGETGGTFTPATASGTLWDVGKWDIDPWGFTSPDDTFEAVRGGGRGMGRHVALALQGEIAAETTYIGSDLFGDAGGLL